MLLFYIDRSQLRWLRHLFWIPTGRLPEEVSQAYACERRPRGGPRTRKRDYVSQHFGVPPTEQDEGDREVWVFLFRLQIRTRRGIVDSAC